MLAKAYVGKLVLWKLKRLTTFKLQR